MRVGGPGWRSRECPAAQQVVTTPALYGDLVSDALGVKVRLEQERIDWAGRKQDACRTRAGPWSQLTEPTVKRSARDARGSTH